MYKVMGGVWNGTDWAYVQEGTEEVYGPFDTYKEAYDTWRTHTFTPMLDNCNHRLFIYEGVSNEVSTTYNRIDSYRRSNG